MTCKSCGQPISASLWGRFAASKTPPFGRSLTAHMRGICQCFSWWVQVSWIIRETNITSTVCKFTWSFSWPGTCFPKKIRILPPLSLGLFPGHFNVGWFLLGFQKPHGNSLSRLIWGVFDINSTEEVMISCAWWWFSVHWTNDSKR